MWYFTIDQPRLDNRQYQRLQQLASLTEVELFNDPYPNVCRLEVESDRYRDTMDYLDREGITYEAATHRPTREELLKSMTND